MTFRFDNYLLKLIKACIDIERELLTIVTIIFKTILVKRSGLSQLEKKIGLKF